MAFSVDNGGKNGGGFSSRRSRSGAGSLAEINVTPFVDVVLVLLIIFMLTAHVMDFGLEVDVPKTVEVESTPKEMPVVTIPKDGTTYLNGKPVNINELREHDPREFRKECRGRLRAGGPDHDLGRDCAGYGQTGRGALQGVHGDAAFGRFGKRREVMAYHPDILDEQERLGRPLAGSVVLHLSFAGFILLYGWAGHKLFNVVQWGDPGGGGMGAVAVTPVSTIKLPSKEGPKNPVANNTESQVPEAPAKKKIVEKVKPDADAIPIKGKNSKKKVRERETAKAAAPNKFREQQQDRPNQLYTPGGAQVSSPLYGMSGGGGLRIGNDSPFGTQYGAYAKLLRDAVARHWSSSEFDSRLNIPAAVVVFTILRDGSLAPGSVKVTQKSGNSALDISAQRAVLDAAPFPPLPAGFNKNEAQVELQFNLK